MELPEPCAAALNVLCASGGQNLTPCVKAFSALLFTLAQRYAFADPEDAVYQALLEIRASAGSWSESRLSARLWVLGIARRRFGQLSSLANAV